MPAPTCLERGERYCSAFQFAMGLERGYDVVQLGEDDFGIYISRFQNDRFGTPLAARGTRAYVDGLLSQHARPSRPRLEIPADGPRAGHNGATGATAFGDDPRTRRPR